MFCFEECEVNLTCFQSESITNGNNLTRLIRKPIPFTVVQNPDFINGVSCLQVIASEFIFMNILYCIVYPYLIYSLEELFLEKRLHPNMV